MRENEFKFWSGTKMFADIQTVMECMRQQMIFESDSPLVGYDHIGIHGAAFLQYTGLKDAKGVKIFEGDIFNQKCDKRHPNGGYIGGTFAYHPENSVVVEFRDGAFWVGSELLNEYLNFHALDGHHVDLIGNIYENSELLERA